MSGETSIHLIPYGDDPLVHLASLLIRRHRNQLPDLSRCVVLFAQSDAIPRFRRILLDQLAGDGHSAVLPPDTVTIANWADRYTDSNCRRLSATGREILLLEMLKKYPDWLEQFPLGAWPLIDSLLALFDELTCHQSELPNDADAMIRRIFHVQKTDLPDPSPFYSEARLVHTLWVAWREQLIQGRLEDQTCRLANGLLRSLESMPGESPLYIAATAEFSPLEVVWLKSLQAKRRLTLVLHGKNTDSEGNHDESLRSLLQELNANVTQPGSDHSYSLFLDNVYAQRAGVLVQRASQQQSESATSPARRHLTIHDTADAESEARAIDLQVRRWLIQGHRDIGIVTHDRKLARRVRALLERANIGLQDRGGWALSTTSAATALARWLECIEQQFAQQPLFDLLKSPFLQLGFERTKLDDLIPVFEQAVVRKRNISFGLDNYRYSLDKIKSDLASRGDTDVADGIACLLDRLEDAAATLMALRHGRSKPAIDFLAALGESLEKLGLMTGFKDDAAGSELAVVLEEMRVAAEEHSLQFFWPDFHRWLRRNMEKRRFHPPRRGRGVELMGFTNSRLYRFDALIIAGATREHLPGRIDAPPFFNDQIRTELGLPSLASRHEQCFQDFRRLLEASPRVVITLRREQSGERVVASPWVERLQTFHQLAYGESLDDPELTWLSLQGETVIVRRDAPLPEPAIPASARLPPEMVPKMITATDHQRLMDCPYQFFCASGLKLAPEKDVREDIEKADFGSHVHRILQAFHSGVDGLPGPWRELLNDENRPEAEDLLREISSAVFASDLRRRFIARGWLYRWEACIPAYLSWEQKHSALWRIQSAELNKQRELRVGKTPIILSGRIDRIDRGDDGYRLIDFKTGYIPSQIQVMQGEKIQLPFYALLLEELNIARAAFLSIEDGEVREKTAIDGQSLAQLRTALEKRLVLLKQQLDESAALPAWGDEETCRLCEMENICRREMWVTTKSGLPS